MSTDTAIENDPVEIVDNYQLENGWILHSCWMLVCLSETFHSRKISIPGVRRMIAAHR